MEWSGDWCVIGCCLNSSELAAVEFFGTEGHIHALHY